MASYNIHFKPSVEKDFQSIPKKEASRIFQRIDQLSTKPFPPQSIKLAGTQRTYRLRVGNYRVVYEVVSQDKKILIHYVRHRREVYRSL